MEPQKRLGSRIANWLVTSEQRRPAAIVLLLIAGLALWRAAGRGPAISDVAGAAPANLEVAVTQPASPAAAVLTTLDPNVATADELMSLPGIGPALAQRIIAYRSERAAKAPGAPAFARVEDLDPIRGIGPATLKRLAPRLHFGGGPATTRAPGATAP